MGCDEESMAEMGDFKQLKVLGELTLFSESLRSRIVRLEGLAFSGVTLLGFFLVGVLKGELGIGENGISAVELSESFLGLSTLVTGRRSSSLAFLGEW